jgi:hypothetical protein
MFNNDPQRDQNRTVFTSALNGFATTVAAMAAVIGGPLLYQYTGPYVIALAQRSYPPEFVNLTAVAFQLACYPFVFFAARASIGVALMVAGSYVALRFL